MTMWVIGDLDSSDGIRVVRDALSHLESEGCSSRLGFVHVPTSTARDRRGFSTVLHQLVTMSALHTRTPADLLSLVDHFDAGVEILAMEGWQEDHGLSHESFSETVIEIARQLGIDAIKPHLIVNGRVSHCDG
jgi:UDP-glucose:glycoprotein glucosyltransferase